MWKREGFSLFDKEEQEMTRHDVVARYGYIDFASKHWPNQNIWMAMLEIPPAWFPSWTVLDTKIPVRHIYCNKDIHKPLLAALQSVHALGLGNELHTFDGCFNIRGIRGGGSFSLHSYGLALDIYARRNIMSRILRTTFSKEFIRCFKEQGFYWGGDWSGTKDPMHFVFGCNG